MTTVRDSAILVGLTAAAGGGKVLTFLTGENGRARLYHRPSARRRRLEFLDSLQGGELLYTPPGERAPGRLHAFDCREVWPAIRADFDRLVHGLHFASLTEMVTGDGESVPELFHLLHLFLTHLEEGAEPRSLRVVFELRMLQFSGFAPSLERCFSCRDSVETGKAAFSAMEGGVLCGDCLRERGGAVRRLSPGALTVMRKALTLSPDKVARLKIGRELREEIRPVVDELIAGVFESNPRTSEFLKRVSQPHPQGGRKAAR